MSKFYFHNVRIDMFKMKCSKLFCVLISLVWLAMSPHIVIAAEIKIATGSKSGVYYPVGQAVSQLLKAKDIHIGVISTAGSEQNVDMLLQGAADLAIVQSDVLYMMSQAKSDESYFKYKDPVKTLRGLAALFPEYTQILVRADSDITGILQLVDKQLYVGKVGSGTYKNATDILSSFGIEKNDYMPYAYDISEKGAVEFLLDGKLDAVFDTSGELKVNDPEFRDKLRMVSLSKEAQERIKKDHPYTSFKQVKDYEGREYGVMFSRALLIAGPEGADVEISRGTIVKLIETLIDNLEIEIQRTDKNIEIFTTGNLIARGITINLHPAAKEYYQEKGVLLNISALQLTALFLFLMLLLALLSYLGVNWKWSIWLRFWGQNRFGTGWSRTVRIWNILVGNAFSITLWVSSFVLLLAVIAILSWEDQYAFTHDVHNRFADLHLGELLTWLITFAATGFSQDLFPHSLFGKIAATVIPIIGLGGVIFVFIYSNLKRNERTDKEARGIHVPRLKDHVIICGWNDRVPALIREITTTNRWVKGRKVIVLSEHEQEKPLESFGFIPGSAFFCRGISSDYDKLKEVNLKDAYCAVIVADYHKVQRGNLRGLYTAVALRKTRQKKESRQEKEFKIIAELHYDFNEDRFRYAGVTKLIPLMRVSSSVIGHACMNPGISDLLVRILSFNAPQIALLVGAAEDKNILQAVKDKTFNEAMKRLRKQDILLLAVHRALGKDIGHAETELDFRNPSPYLLNPSAQEDSEYRISEQDDLLIIKSNMAGTSSEQAWSMELGRNLLEQPKTRVYNVANEHLLIIGRDEEIRNVVSTVKNLAQGVISISIDADEKAKITMSERSGVSYLSEELPDFSLEHLESFVCQHKSIFAEVTRAVILEVSPVDSNTEQEDVIYQDDAELSYAMVLLDLYRKLFKKNLHVVAEMRADVNLHLYHDIGIAQPIPINRLIELILARMVFRCLSRQTVVR
uniref:TRAP transporter solute receptor, TAXI family n=1 Tax=Candidatus Kentrum sp. LPFa TaxID=2126335 RepID=A0A450WEN0_9GAMM|nr:MAG: TRAP transporter solute receptor, TAXI family [Candidatus Kentron sp. LPFa]